MTYFKYTIIILIAFCLSFLDIAFFSFLEIYGATILSSFIFLIIFSITDKTKRDYMIASLAVVLFYSIFSSLPLPIIFTGFFIIPASIGYIRERYLPEPTPIVSILYFFVSALLFEGILVAYVKAWNPTGLLTLSWFVFLHILVGFLCYLIFFRLRKKLSRGEIKF